MSTPEASPSQYVLTVGDITVDVKLKAIKNLHLSVHPPTGHVHLSAPLSTSKEAVELAIVSQMGWIRRRQRQLQGQPRQSRREFVSGESHYVSGQRYLLEVIELDKGDRVSRESVRLRNKRVLEMRVREGAKLERREALMRAWYRKRLEDELPVLVEKWQDMLGIDDLSWSIRRMRRRWGGCNSAQKKIWINLELAKKPQVCLEYILAHEMAH